MSRVPDTPLVEIRIAHRLGGFELDLELSLRGPTVAIMGPTGAGKSTLLRVLAGLTRAERAFVRVDGELFDDTAARVHRAPEARRLGCLFQEPLLFPHLNVEENLRFAGRRRGVPAPERERIVELLELGALLGRRTRHLSGGERQRVALGRALLSRPRLLLLDEPLAALDLGFKARLLPALRRVRAELGIPMLLVTHAFAEATQLADEIVLMHEGRVLVQGPVDAVQTAPELARVAGAIDFDNSIPVVVDAVDPEGGTARVCHGAQCFKVPAEGLVPGARVEIMIRAEDVILSMQDPRGTSLRNHLAGTIERLTGVDGRVVVQVDCGPRLRADVTREAVRELGLEPGVSVYCLFKTRAVRVLGAGRDAG